MKLAQNLMLSVVLLAQIGCSSVSEKFENRISITPGGDQVFTNSMYGPFGITSKISDKDRDALVNRK